MSHRFQYRLEDLRQRALQRSISFPLKKTEQDILYENQSMEESQKIIYDRILGDDRDRC